LTKIISATVVCQDILPSDWKNTIKIPELYVRSEESRANLKQGYLLTLEDLFHALLLQSGNDAAQAISQLFFEGPMN
jgi:D-alanyl-D-alanine carboxypeptidase